MRDKKHACYVLIVISTISYIVYLVAVSYSKVPLMEFSTTCGLKPKDNNTGPCSNVLEALTKGSWKLKNDLSEKDVVELDIRKALKSKHISLQRDDDQCGNTHLYTETYFQTLFNTRPVNFRALCDPDGPKPCCYDNICMDKSTLECQCDRCYDLRQEIHAELADWVPDNNQCQVQEFNPQEACDVITKRFNHIVVMGDSLMRHVMAGLLILLRQGPGADSLLHPNTPKEIKQVCTKYYQLLHKQCNNEYIWKSATLCNGNLKLTLAELYSIDVFKKQKGTISELDLDEKSLIIMGAGLHDDLNSQYMINDYIKPALNEIYKERTKLDEADSNNPVLTRHKHYPSSVLPQLTNTGSSNGNKHYTDNDENDLSSSKRPSVLWSGIHRPGLLKSLHLVQQDVFHVLQYNKDIKEFLGKYCIPILNNEHLSDGVFSIDGTHYGYGVNVLKAKIIVNYISSLNVDG
ncbi:unnamed protein product [Owenia fusiformis]|uniref:Uncharacterized protein n=1 Tax=Owenia fusiformis TaxID=6347 RepID=A0A8J1TZ40_OWEFU|nr:unnamed protein product [Owenia fusiformis]